MKKEILFGLCMGIIAMASCQKERITPPETDNLATVTIRADFANPSDTPSTKTSVEYDPDQGEYGTFIPRWTENDKLGVFTELNGVKKSNNRSFSLKTIHPDGSATFTGDLDMTAIGQQDLYAYYPKGTSTSITACVISLPNSQQPSATSFDGSTDILLAYPTTVTINEDGSVSDVSLNFTRKTAMVVLNLTFADNAITEITKVELIVPDTYQISGKKKLNLKNGTFSNGTASETDNTVTADYPAGVPASTMVLMNVYPVQFAAGDQLTIKVTGSDKEATHTMTLAEANAFKEAQAAMLNIDFKAEEITSSGDIVIKRVGFEAEEGFIASDYIEKTENDWHFNRGSATVTKNHLISGVQSAYIIASKGAATPSFLELIEPVTGVNYITFKIRRCSSSTADNTLKVSHKIGSGTTYSDPKTFTSSSTANIVECRYDISDTSHTDPVYIKFEVSNHAEKEQSFSIDDIVFYKSIQ